MDLREREREEVAERWRIHMGRSLLLLHILVSAAVLMFHGSTHSINCSAHKLKFGNCVAAFNVPLYSYSDVRQSEKNPCF